VRDDVPAMSDDRPTDVLGALPRTRPHRRSAKRAAPAAAASTPAKDAAEPTAPAKRAAARTAPAKAKPATGRARTRTQGPEPIRQPAQPAGTPSQPRANRVPVPPSGAEILGTAVHAAAELAEIGLTAGTRALRNAIARLPRP
jgi:hypothetical protein